MTSRSLEHRAMAAYWRGAGPGTDQPTTPDVITCANSRRYVVLHNANGLLAVYRVLTDETLKRLKRWPDEISAAYARRDALR